MSDKQRENVDNNLLINNNSKSVIADNDNSMTKNTNNSDSSNCVNRTNSDFMSSDVSVENAAELRNLLQRKYELERGQRVVEHNKQRLQVGAFFVLKKLLIFLKLLKIS